MTNRWAERLHLTGEMNRRTFWFIGLGAFAIKYAVDCSVAWFIFHRVWRPWDYLRPISGSAGFYTIDPSFAYTMLAVALPFILLGVICVKRRLRSAGWPTWLVALFFFPVLNIVFLGILGLAPRGQASSPTLRLRRKEQNSQFLLHATLAVLFAMPVCIGAVWLGVTLLERYGWGLFVALPFCLGLLSVLALSWNYRPTMKQCLGVATLSVMIPGVGMLAFAVEGFGCLLMALPLALPLAILGGAVGYAIQMEHPKHVNQGAILLLVIVFPSLIMGAEQAAQIPAEMFAVRTEIEIAAPPERVWRHVVSFSELPPPTEWVFRTGIAYPIRARIEGQGVGAVRKCEFSTGPFVEPIKIWDEPRLLRFNVTANPAPMEEWTPYPNVHPKHLDNYLSSKQGQFLLTRLPGGRTRLEGTTWYVHSLWPAEYWKLWSDYVIHTIHLRVLRHVKALAEA